MSGIAGIVHLDGAPVDHVLLERMTRFLAPRGPDAQRIWIKGGAGLGHALLITDPGSDPRPQPCTVDGRAWITADARLDARDELIHKLSSRIRGSAVLPATAPSGRGSETVAEPRPSGSGYRSDAELILQAYHFWDEACLDHLFGEYVFAIWDSERRRLFCAHDQLGTRPLFFAHQGEKVIFSNTLDCVRQHPAVSAKINDAAIGDFLLCGLNYNPETTSFADIRRLPPANFASWQADRHVYRRYWRMPIDEPLYYKRRQDYVDQFRSLLRTAVKERMPGGKLGIYMSGGLDSTLLAAVAQGLRRESAGRQADQTPESPGGIFAVTSVCDHSGRDPDRHYSTLAARHLGIVQHFSVMDGPESEESWSKIPEPCTEPTCSPWTTNQNRRFDARLTSLGRVYFYGQGPDNALTYEWKPYLAYLARRRRWARLVKDVGLHVWRHRRIPLLPTLPRVARDARAQKMWEPVFPAWLNPEFSKRMCLEERWRELWAASVFEHPVRPSGYESFKSVLWQYLFEACDSRWGQRPIEFRHPYLNLPLLRFMLVVPALPWCRVKHIQRIVASEVLPEEVVKRPKSPAIGPRAVQIAERHGVPPLSRSAALKDYLSVSSVRYTSGEPLYSLETVLCALGLSYWLRELEVQAVYR
jgi:asparagine synthase (glutamine-hydrolysing)